MGKKGKKEYIIYPEGRSTSFWCMCYLSSLGGAKQKSVFIVMKRTSEWKIRNVFKKLGLHLFAVRQQPTEQMVLSLLAFVMILQDSMLGALKSGSGLQKAVTWWWKYDPPGGVVPDGIHSLVSVSIFHCQLCETELPRVCFSKAGMKRNPLGMTDISVGFRGAVTAVHITWHRCPSRPLRHVEHISTDVWRNSFLELRFGSPQIGFSTWISKF